MTQSIQTNAPSVPEHSIIRMLKNPPLDNHSSLSTYELKKTSFIWRVGSYFFSFFTRIISWFVGKVAPTQYELELIQDLKDEVENVLIFLLDRAKGQEQLKKVIVSCDNLYKTLEKKWLAQTERAIFLRGNLLIIKLGAYIILGDLQKVDECQKNLSRHGIIINKKYQKFLALVLDYTCPSKENEERIALINTLSKLGLEIIEKYKNPEVEQKKQIDTLTRIANGILEGLKDTPENQEKRALLKRFCKIGMNHIEKLEGNLSIEQRQIETAISIANRILNGLEDRAENQETLDLIARYSKIGMRVAEKFKEPTPENQEKIETFTRLAKRILERLEENPDNLEDIETLHNLTKYSLENEKTFLGKIGRLFIGRFSAK